MQNRVRMKGQGALKLLMNIVIAIMCLVLVICAVTAAREIFDTGYDREEERDFYYCLTDGSFYRMVNYYYYNVENGYEDDNDLQEYYAIAEYFEAASLYKAFLKSGDMDRAQYQQDRMKLALERMGEWSMVEQDILAQLCLQ